MNDNIKQACRTTLKILMSDDIKTPNSMNQDLSTMQNVLVGILQGSIILSDAKPPQPTPAEPPEGAPH